MVNRAIESKHNPNFASQWWKQAQATNRTILTKPVLRRELEEKVKELEKQLAQKGTKKDRYKHDLQLILNKWKFDDKPLTSAEEFLNKFTPWINWQSEKKKELEVFLTTYKANNLTELAEKLDQSQQNHLNYLETLQDKQELEFKYSELEKEKGNWLAPYLAKIESLEAQLINLAKQKLASKKEAQELVKQLEQNWSEDKKQHEKDRDNWAKELAKSREIITNLEKEKSKQQEQIKTLSSNNDKLSKEKDKLVLDKNGLNENILTLTNDKKILVKQLEEREKEEQDQLRKINVLFDENAKDYGAIDFNGLYSLLTKIAEREREREREQKVVKVEEPKKADEVKPIFGRKRKAKR